MAYSRASSRRTWASEAEKCRTSAGSVPPISRVGTSSDTAASTSLGKTLTPSGTPPATARYAALSTLEHRGEQ